MLTFIVNPVAGSGYALKASRQMDEVLKQRNVPYRMLYTSAPGHATELAREAASQADCTGVIAVGGDGTAYEVACGLLNGPAPMGIIPVGTGNDYIKTVGTPKDMLEALEFILTHPARPVDVGRVNDRLFLNVCGTGFDVTVLEYTQAAKKYCRGILPYLIGLIRGISRYKPTHIRYTVDGVTQEQDVLICSIANGRYFGGGIPICPDASPDDGSFDLVLLEHKPRWMIPFYLPALLMGRVLKFPFTTHRRCQHVQIMSEGMHFNTDGEVFPMDKAEVTLLPEQLKLFW